MKKTLLFLSIFTSYSIAQLPNKAPENTGSIVINDTDLKSGGKEFYIKGNPDVVFETEYGKVYADETQILILEDNHKRIHHKGSVNLSLKNTNLVIESDDLLDDGNGLFVFSGDIFIKNYAVTNKSLTSYSCHNGVVYKNGKSTGHTSVTAHNVLTISCDSMDNVTVKVK